MRERPAEARAWIKKIPKSQGRFRGEDTGEPLVDPKEILQENVRWWKKIWERKVPTEEEVQAEWDEEYPISVPPFLRDKVTGEAMRTQAAGTGKGKAAGISGWTRTEIQG